MLTVLNSPLAGYVGPVGTDRRLASQPESPRQVGAVGNPDPRPPAHLAASGALR